MKLQISEIANLMGVSVRTLHYYDDIGLLKPAEIDERTGYRFYDESSIEKLKQILYYREMDFSLKEVSSLLAEKDVYKKRKLLERRRVLQDKINQMELLIKNMDADLSKPIELEGWFDKILRDYNYSGFSYQSGPRGGFYVWGKADYEKDQSFTLNSRFPIGSMTKQFTAVCALLLEEKGLLDTDTCIGTYLPECRYGDKIKIKHLLNMSSGLSDQLTSDSFSNKLASLTLEAGQNISEEQQVQLYHQVDAFFARKKSREEILKIIYASPLKFAPGEQFDFNGMNYEILGMIMEQVSGRSLDTLFEEYIFRPLEMQDTSFEGIADVKGYVGNVPVEYSHAHDGSWGLLTTAEDMVKWCEALLDRKLLSEKQYEKLFAPNDFAFSCGWNRMGENTFFSCDISEVSTEVQLNFAERTYYIAARNRVPVPEHKDRLMYFIVKGCDDGRVRLEVWKTDVDTGVKVSSIKVYDKGAWERYSYAISERGYILLTKSHEEKHSANDSVQDCKSYIELDLSAVLGEQFDSNATYILEVRAEIDAEYVSQIGVKYLHNGETESMGYYIFFHYRQGYELFMEALGNVMEGLGYISNKS